ncbi:MAG: DUF1648 domain-containing protein [Candidatus Altiarchaeota archaeon]
MKSGNTILALSLIMMVSFAVGLYAYQQMPDRVASHWNAQGKVDGYMPKFWGVFLMPVIMALVSTLFLLIPRIDPLKANIDKFRGYYQGFILIVAAFLLYIYLLTVFWNFGHRFNMTLALVPALGLLYYCVGIVMGHAQRNWFIGIRTPWTLSSDVVWRQTHEKGAKLFKASGLVAVLGAFFQDYAIVLAVGPVIISSFYLMAYSYFSYQKEAKRGP